MRNRRVRITPIIIMALLLTVFVPPASALERFEIVTTRELQQMMTRKAAGQLDFVLVNTLDTLIYEHHSIPGSVNIPWSQVAELADRLGPDRNRLIITYCMGYR